MPKNIGKKNNKNKNIKISTSNNRWLLVYGNCVKHSTDYFLQFWFTKKGASSNLDLVPFKVLSALPVTWVLNQQVVKSKQRGLKKLGPKASSAQNREQKIVWPSSVFCEIHCSVWIIAIQSSYYMWSLSEPSWKQFILLPVYPQNIPCLFINRPLKEKAPPHCCLTSIR